MRPSFNSDYPPPWNRTTAPFGPCTDKLSDSGQRVYYAWVLFVASSAVPGLALALALALALTGTLALTRTPGLAL